jgi:hypothetical protein
MDLTLAEVRVMMTLRELTRDQRAQVYLLILSLLPPDVPLPPMPPGGEAPGLH